MVETDWKLRQVSLLLVKQLGLSEDYFKKHLKLLPYVTPLNFVSYKNGEISFYVLLGNTLEFKHKVVENSDDIVVKDPELAYARMKIKYGIDDITKVTLKQMS